MSLRRPPVSLRTICALTVLVALATFATACGTFSAASTITAAGQPAMGYDFGSTEPLRVAVIDETGGTDWAPSINAAVATYGGATSRLLFQDRTEGANIVVHVRRYSDSRPPELRDYLFTPGMGGFATVYDADGSACNFPPSTLPMGCSGEIAEATLYLNDIIPDGVDIATRRLRLVLHEMGHGLGLERHAPDLDIDGLATRYGWDQQ